MCALTSSRLMIFPVQLLMYCNDHNIFFGGGNWAFFWGGLGKLVHLKYPSIK